MQRVDADAELLFDGPGEMRELCRALDWSATTLGPVAGWPLSLRTLVAILLASRHPMFLWWGSELVQIYNDAYRPSFGSDGRHLRALGARGGAFWTEIWDIIGPQITQVMSGGDATWHENQLVPIERNGHIEDVWWTYSYGPAFDDAGRRGGVLVVCQETTVHVLAEQERERLVRALEVERARLTHAYFAEQQARAALQDALQAAEAANRAKGEFLAVMSHELRTPLNAIGGYAELIEMGIRGPVTPEQREDLRRIQTSQRHLLGLINEVLNYAKLETGTVHYDLTDVPLSEALSGAQALVAPQARLKGLTLVVSEHATELSARADVEKLRQILANLLSNAVKFTDPAGTIELSCTGDADWVRIRVRDTGIGIARERTEDIFDPFVQVRADLTRPHEGTGLGLAISRDLARGMGGDVTVQSEAGVGSTFTLTLPRSA